LNLQKLPVGNIKKGNAQEWRGGVGSIWGICAGRVGEVSPGMWNEAAVWGSQNQKKERGGRGVKTALWYLGRQNQRGG